MLDAPPADIIVVTGRGLEADDRLAASVVIGRQAIDRAASGRLEDVLRDVAGLASFRRSDSRSANPTSQGLTLRGLGGNAASRVTIAVDGVPQADPFGGWVAFGALDPHGLDRISLVRGGGAGAGNVAGSIEIDSRAPSESEPLDARAAFGSRQSLDLKAFGGGAWKTGFASLSASHSGSAGFVPIVAEDRGPVDRRAPYRQDMVRVRLVQSLGRNSEAQASLSTYRDLRERGTDFTDNAQRGVDASLRLVSNGDTRWSLLGYLQDRRFDSEFAAISAGRLGATKTLDQHVPARGHGARGELGRTIGAVSLSAGVEWRRVDGTTEEQFRFVGGEPTRLREAGGTSTTSGLFGTARWSRGRWSAALDARADRWVIGEGRLLETDLGGAPLIDSRFDRRRGWEPSARMALGRTIEEVTLRAAAYRAWRLPTLNELYRPFRAGADATAANASLDPEHLRGVEVGADWRPSRRASLSATVFTNRLGGAIANVSQGNGPGVFGGVGFVAAGGTYRSRQNLDAILTRGIEVDGALRRGAWNGSLSYALTDARVSASGAASALDGKRPAQVARHQASASLGWEGRALSLDATVRMIGRQFEDDNGDRWLPAAMTADLAARWKVHRRLAVELRVENLFDEAVVATVASDGTRERALPRNLWLGVRFR